MHRIDGQGTRESGARGPETGPAAEGGGRGDHAFTRGGRWMCLSCNTRARSPALSWFWLGSVRSPGEADGTVSAFQGVRRDNRRRHITALPNSLAIGIVTSLFGLGEPLRFGSCVALAAPRKPGTGLEQPRGSLDGWMDGWGRDVDVTGGCMAEDSAALSWLA